MTDPNSATANTYTLRDGPLLSVSTMTTATAGFVPFSARYNYDAAATNYSSTYKYDANSALSYVAVADGRPRMMTYLSNAGGQRVWTWEKSGTVAVTGLASAFTMGVTKTGVFDGIVFRSSSETPIGYYGAILDRAQAGPLSSSLYDGGFEPASPHTTPAAAGSYTVRPGETLQSIAAATWGDASLWYVIAEANGLSGSGQIAAGTRLVIPNRVVNVHNTSDTFRPYNPNDNLGEVAPIKAAPPKTDKGCGALGQILMVIITVVVAFYTGQYVGGLLQGSAATLSTGAAITAGAIGGAVGSIAGQVFGVAAGVIDKFNWKAVGLAAIGGAVGAGVGKMIPQLGVGASAADKFVDGVHRGIAGSIISQGIGVATGLQDRFDWRGVAVAGIIGGATSWAGAGLDTLGVSRSGMTYDLLTGMAGGIAGAGARSLMDGSSFGDNLLAVLPDVIGSTIGNMVAGGIQQAAEDRAVKKFAAEAEAAAALERSQGASQGMLDDGVWRGDSGDLLVDADVRPFDFWSPYVRRSERYADIQNQLEVGGYGDSFYFSAVSKMTANLANMDNFLAGSLADLSPRQRQYGETLSQGIADFNEGQLTGILSGKITERGAALDTRLIRDEQHYIQQRLNVLSKADPGLYRGFIQGVNRNANITGGLDIINHVTDPYIARAADRTRTILGGSINFASEAHRNVMGGQMVRVMRESHNLQNEIRNNMSRDPAFRL